MAERQSGSTHLESVETVREARFECIQRHLSRAGGIRVDERLQDCCVPTAALGGFHSRVRDVRGVAIEIRTSSHVMSQQVGTSECVLESQNTYSSSSTSSDSSSCSFTRVESR